jgi:hypothetical protein
MVAEVLVDLSSKHAGADPLAIAGFERIQGVAQDDDQSHVITSLLQCGRHRRWYEVTRKHRLVRNEDVGAARLFHLAIEHIEPERFLALRANASKERSVPRSPCKVGRQQAGQWVEDTVPKKTIALSKDRILERGRAGFVDAGMDCDRPIHTRMP